MFCFFHVQETQLQHEVSMKTELLQKFIKDQEMDEFYQLSHRSDEDSRRWVFRVGYLDSVPKSLTSLQGIVLGLVGRTAN